MTAPGAPEPHRLTPEEVARRRRRSIAIAVALGVLVILFFVTTVIRLSSNVAHQVTG